MITDEPLHCFVTVNTHTVIILPLTTVDVPSAFTPNGDGVNDVVFPDGWGIRKLLNFRILNRYGEIVFETSTLKHGWDGTFRGVPQNMETYVYQVEVETYQDASPTIFKSGTVKLIR
jgi:gliding motility-associated-like protein